MIKYSQILGICYYTFIKNLLSNNGYKDIRINLYLFTLYKSCEHLIIEMYIVIIDDHSLIAESLKSLLGIAYPGSRIDTYYTVATFKELYLARGLPDIILCDILIQGDNGISLLQELRREHGNTPKIIMMSSITDVYTIKDAFKKGANGYVSKDARQEDLIEAIEKAKNDKRFVNKAMQEKLLKHVFADDEVSYHLSARENEVLQLICKGLTPKEITTEMKLSIHTVQHYIKNIMRKFKVNRTTELVVFAIQKGLYYPDQEA